MKKKKECDMVVLCVMFRVEDDFGYINEVFEDFERY